MCVFGFILATAMTIYLGSIDAPKEVIGAMANVMCTMAYLCIVQKEAN